MPDRIRRKPQRFRSASNEMPDDVESPDSGAVASNGDHYSDSTFPESRSDLDNNEIPNNNSAPYFIQGANLDQPSADEPVPSVEDAMDIDTDDTAYKPNNAIDIVPRGSRGGRRVRRGARGSTRSRVLKLSLNGNSANSTDGRDFTESSVSSEDGLSAVIQKRGRRGRLLSLRGSRPRGRYRTRGGRHENSNGHANPAVSPTAENDAETENRPDADSFLRGGWNRGMKTGTRVAEPSNEFKTLLRDATDAFMARELHNALELTLKAMELNPEIFAAHSLLSQIYSQMGEEDKALDVLWFGANSLRDPGVWWEVAALIEAIPQNAQNQDQLRGRLLVCYQKILQYDRSDPNARRKRLEIFVAQGSTQKALREIEHLLQGHPEDLHMLRLLAETGHAAQKIGQQGYAYAIGQLRKKHPDFKDSGFTFDDLNIFAELTDSVEEPHAGLQSIKATVRWMAGREDETFWNDVTTNDCEWDLEHEPRRMNVQGFKPEAAHPLETYGEFLVVEIRVKLGIFRLKLVPRVPLEQMSPIGKANLYEAIHHFELVDFGENNVLGNIQRYADMLYDIAAAFYDKNFFAQALQYYEKLQRIQPTLSLEARSDMAECYRRADNPEKAATLLEEIAAEKHQDAIVRARLVKLYGQLGNRTKVKQWYHELGLLRKTGILKSVDISGNRVQTSDETSITSPQERLRENVWGVWPTSQAAREVDESETAFDRLFPDVGVAEPELSEGEAITYYEDAESELPAVKSGDPTAMLVWKSQVESLLHTFGLQKIFYEYNSSVPFLGWTIQAKEDARKAWTHHLPIKVGIKNSPQTFKGIPFDKWLKIFCEYALRNAADGNAQRVYDVLELAENANVFWQYEERLLEVQVCRLICALVLGDEHQLWASAIWFSQTFPLSSETYTLSIAMQVLLDNEQRWFGTATNHQHFQKCIKSIDAALLGERLRVETKILNKTTDLLGREANEEERKQIRLVQPIVLVLCAQIMSRQGNFLQALHYLFRAYAIDPNNTGVTFLISTTCLNLATIGELNKKDLASRIRWMQQGVAYFNEYKKRRLGADAVVEDGNLDEVLKQRNIEVTYNEGRMWLLLGNLPGGVQILNSCIHEGNDDTTNGDFKFQKDAALALHHIYAQGGSVEKASEITKERLVF